MIGYYTKAQKILEEYDGLGSVWISGRQFAKDVSALKENKIDVVCACMVTDIRYKPQDNIKQIRFPIQDTVDCDIKAYFQPTFEVIEEGIKCGNVLIHSESGISRCGAIAISYLMKKRDWTYKKGLQVLREARPCILPNDNFEKQLKWYEKYLRGIL